MQALETKTECKQKKSLSISILHRKAQRYHSPASTHATLTNAASGYCSEGDRQLVYTWDLDFYY